MKYRRFGKTGLTLPLLTFGAMRSMITWNEKVPKDIDRETEDKLYTLLQTALDHGINHLETAHGYGSSEYELGRILPRFNRHDLIIQTKVGPEDDPQKFVDKVMLSLEHLQVDYLDLLAIHGINDYKSLWQCCRKNGCLQAARELQKKGIIGHIGFSGHGPLDVILEAINFEEYGGFDYVNLHWYYIFDINRPAIKRAKERDLGVYIISPTDKGGRLWDPSEVLLTSCTPMSPIMFNDCYCLLQDGVSGIGIGASAPEHFDEHLQGIARLAAPETQKTIEEIDAKLRMKMKQETGCDRPDEDWLRYPSWLDIPNNINISFILWLFNLYKGWGLTAYAKERYGKLGSGSRWVQGNKGSSADAGSLAALCKKVGQDPDRLAAILKEAHRHLS